MTSFKAFRLKDGYTSNLTSLQQNTAGAAPAVEFGLTAQKIAALSMHGSWKQEEILSLELQWWL